MPHTCWLKGAGVVVVPDEVNFRAEKATRNKGRKSDRESIHQEDVTTLNIYAPNKRTTKYMKQKLNKL